VVGYADGELVYIFSHAYSGSSGSGVFSTDGKYIGMIMAIDVGQNELGVDVLENIVIVTPSFKIDWAVILD
jgi:V8-like Glu-specific endopeptidase